MAIACSSPEVISMDRREFLIRGTRALLLLPLGTFLVACGSGDDGTTSYTPPTEPTPPDSTPPDAPPELQGDNVVYTSSVTDAHSHSFSIPIAALASPPEAGLSGNTTSSLAHTHTLLLTEADLRAAAVGQSVKKVTSSDLGHTHTFTIVKVT